MVQSEAQRRAKAKYYAKLKENEEYRAYMAQRSRDYYQKPENKEKKKRIYEMREDGSYTKDNFAERKEEIENEIAATKISLSEARIEQFDIEGALTYATSFIRDLGRQWFDLEY